MPKVGQTIRKSSPAHEARQRSAGSAPVVQQTAHVKPITQPEGRTDAANAIRLAAKFSGNVRFVPSWNKYIAWDSQRWNDEAELKVQAQAKQVVKGLWPQLAKAQQGGQLDRETHAAMYRFVLESNNVSRLNAMVALARSEPGVAADVEQFDRDPFLFNLLNGTVDLRTGICRKHRKEDYITKLAPVKYDPDAWCPTWVRFNSEIFSGNTELIKFIQRVVGYCLTGDTREHAVFVGYGSGGNGKSVFVETISKLLGPHYAMKAAPDLLLAKRSDSHPTAQADLYGKRFVAAIESGAGSRLNETLVKELTGGDRIRARRMYENYWEFPPTHHVWLLTNHKPVIGGTDNGIWRRIKLIPFDVTIEEAKQDKLLPVKLQAELPGILNWAIAGCLDWQRNGLQEPDVVKSATSAYRTEMDDVGQFIKEYCTLGEKLNAPATLLYQTFVTEMGSDMTQRQFGMELRTRGFERTQISKGIYRGKKCWKGLALRQL